MDVEGDAVLLGLKRSSTTTHEDYKANDSKARNGRLILYVLKKNYNARASVAVSVDGLPLVNLTL